MTRLTCLALAACLPTLAALGQMAEQPVVDLQAGLIIDHAAKVDLAHNDDGVFRLPDNVERKVGDFTFTCSLRVDHEPGDSGDHAMEFASVSADDSAPLLLSMWEGSVVLAESLAPTSGRHAGTLKPPLANRTISIAVVIKRDAKQALSGLWLDGIEVESFNIPVGAVTLDKEAIAIGGTLHSGIVSNIRLYNRALSRPEIIASAQQDAPKPSVHTITLLGSTEAVLMAESGWLEAYLALKSVGAADGQRIVLRNLAWEGDTVWRQDRPLNFGPLEQQLDRVQAQQVVVMFGRQECLDRGEAGLAGFRTALDALVAKCPRGALLMGCLPFNEMPPPQRDLSKLNPVLARYDEAIKAVAEARGGKFFDTAKSCRKQEQAWTRDGVTLNADGAWLLGDITSFALGWLGQTPADADMARLRTLAQAKEQLWHKYWRPSNWAFLYGDRTTQPSSRDHLNPSVRWFPQELEQYRALIDAKETELWKLSQELGRKLP